MSGTDVDVGALMAEIARLKVANDALQTGASAKAKPKGIHFKVSQKGAVSVYGINSRLPVTLYKNQWIRLLEKCDDIKEFIKEHDAELATKEVAEQ